MASDFGGFPAKVGLLQYDAKKNVLVAPTGAAGLQLAPGGKVRGPGAVDLQFLRANPDEVAGGEKSMILGGQNNKILASGLSSGNNKGHVIVGGMGNWSGSTNGERSYCFIGGGANNRTLHNYGFVGGGYENKADGDSGVCVGGFWNQAGSYPYVFVGGGAFNTCNDNYGVIGGGYSNFIGAAGSNTIAGGWDSTISGTSSNSFIGGGASNSISGAYTTIVGGQANQSANIYAFIGGGYSNNASGATVTIAGGNSHVASGQNSSIGGGAGNTTSGTHSTIAGGGNNSATQSYATVGGGLRNQALYQNSVIPGGWGAITRGAGAMALANGGFTANGSGGDAQQAWYTFSRDVGAGGPYEVHLDRNSSYVLAVNAGYAASFHGNVIAKTILGGHCAAWEFKGALQHYNGQLQFIGTPTVTLLGATAGEAETWTVAVAIVNNNRICLQATGGTTGCRLVGNLHAAEVVYSL